jgi:hypothetical protein
MKENAQFIPALTKPYTYFSFYKESKDIEGFWLRFMAILAVSGLLHALSFFAAFPSFKTIHFVAQAKLTAPEMELLRYMLALVGGVWGIIAPFLAIQAGTIFLYLFFRDIGYKALFYVMSVIYILFLAGLAFELPFQFASGAEEVVQPLGLGFLGVLIFKHGFWQELFNLLNVFTVWGTAVTYYALRQLSFKSKSYCLIITLGTCLFCIFLFSLYAALISGQWI